MKKRILSLLLTVVMLVVMLPTTAFAATTRSLTLAEVDKQERKPGDTFVVDVNISGNANSGYFNYGMYITYDSDVLELVSVENGGASSGAFAQVTSLPSDAAFADLIMASDPQAEDGALAKVTFKVKESAVVNSTTLDLVVDEFGDENDDEIANEFGSVSTTITVSSATPAVEGYSASITADPTEVVVANTGTVKVNVTHDKDTTFAAGEVVLTIPSNVNVAATGAVKNASGAAVDYTINGTTLTIEDFGADKNLGNGVYVITYTAGNTAGKASFALSSAAFSDKDNAQKSDLIGATTDQTAQVVTIINAPVAVSVDSSAIGYFKYDTSAPYGEAYTFYKEETTGAYYNYSDVQYKVGDGEWTSLTESNGSWTIPAVAVTGAITIKGTRTGIQPTVTWLGDGAADITTKPTAQYGVDFVVTLPADKEPDTTPGYVYGISATMNGETIGNYDQTTRQFTITGTAITNDFTVTVTKTTQKANQFNVTISSTPGLSTDVTAAPTVVNIGESTTLTLAPEAGYTYVIKVDGVDKTSEFADDNQYTVEDVQASVSVEVTKTVDITNAKVTHYLQLNETVMWLITIAPDANETQLSNKLYTYNGNNMYWSSEYKAYCYLVIDASELTLAASDFAINAGTVTPVDYGMDVNDTNKVDANDAQLVYNMYKQEYNDFTSDVTIEKFLRADVNGDALSTTKTYEDAINVDDAAAIITAILEATANSTN